MLLSLFCMMWWFSGSKCAIECLGCYWKDLKHKRLAIVALAAIGANLTMVSMLMLWWGGWSYGPRELTDTIPFYALLTMLGCRAFLDESSIGLQRAAATIAAGLVLLMLSVVMNAPGALSAAANAWNAWAHLEEHPDRLWDWRDHAAVFGPAQLNSAARCLGRSENPAAWACWPGGREWIWPPTGRDPNCPRVTASR